jgi:hypothetical protein
MTVMTKIVKWGNYVITTGLIFLFAAWLYDTFRVSQGDKFSSLLVASFMFALIVGCEILLLLYVSKRITSATKSVYMAQLAASLFILLVMGVIWLFALTLFGSASQKLDFKQVLFFTGSTVITLYFTASIIFCVRQLSKLRT